MKYVFLITLIVLAGCRTPTPINENRISLSLAHPVVIPEKYQVGGTSPLFPGTASAERYVEAYEKGWWRCLKTYTEDIDYQFRSLDFAACGWPARIDGFLDGALAARNRVRLLVKTCGKHETHNFLVEAFAGAP